MKKNRIQQWPQWYEYLGVNDGELVYTWEWMKYSSNENSKLYFEERDRNINNWKSMLNYIKQKLGNYGRFIELDFPK